MASLATLNRKVHYVGVKPPTGDYNDMDNKPAIDGVELTSSTTKADLGLDTVYNYKGQVATYDDLPSSGNHVGDVWNVADTGENYAWNEDDEWDKLTGADAVYFRNGQLESSGLALSIDADKNTISNIETENLKSGVLQTTVRAISSASDIALASEKAIRTELNTKQDTIDSNHKLSSDLVDDTNATNLFVTSTEKSTWTGKQDAINDLEAIRSGAAAGATALQSGDLKTVNGESVVGSGDIVITTNYSFDNSWTTNTTISDFLDDVYDDVKAIPGMTYIGELTCSDLPTGLNNAEAVVEVMPSATAATKALHVVITSGNLDPYRWELTYWVIGNTPHNSGWIAFQPKLTQGTGITISNNTISTDALRNTATGTNSLTIAGTATTSSNSINIGVDSVASEERAVAIGKYARANAARSTVIGYEARAASGSENTASWSVVIGDNCMAYKACSVSIGRGIDNKGKGSVVIGHAAYNTDDNTFKVSLNSSTTTAATNESTGLYTLLNSSGKVPVGRYITMTGADGTNAGTTGSVPAPSATDNTKFLKGDGTWATVDALPSQSGQSGKFLTTDGSVASWATLDTALNGTTAPTNATVGSLGQIYVDTVANEGYVCTNINSNVYTWKRITYTPSSTTVTLASSSWNTSTKEYTLPVVGLTSATIVWLAPSVSADNSNEEAYATYGVRVKAQSNGSITLGCSSVPPVDINVELII